MSTSTTGRILRAAPGSRTCRALGESLVLRIRRGEGQILLVPAGMSMAAGAQPAAVVVTAVAATMLLVSLYAFNDLCDCERDARDPTRGRGHAVFLATHRGEFLVAVIAAGLAAVALGALGAGGPAVPAMLVVIAVNTAYSMGLKGVPGIDLLCAPLWGGGFAAMAGAADIREVALVAAMTTVCHVFQVRRDVAVDDRNGVRTLLVAVPRAGAVAVAAGCGAMAWALSGAVHPLAGATAAVPIALFLSPLPNTRAWVLAKVWFAVVFVAALVARP